MPRFDTEVDIDVSEFIDSCTDRETESLIQYLKDDGKIPMTLEDSIPEINLDADWKEALMKLLPRKCLLTVEEENLILKISGRLV